MKRRVFALVSVVAILAMVFVALPVSAAPKPPDYSPMDAGPRIREMPATPDMILPVSQQDLAGEAAAAEAVVNASSTDCVTASKIFLILNDYTGRYQATYFNLMGESAGSQIWVQANLAWPAADPRPTPVVTCEQAAYMIGQFDGNIQPKEWDFFGQADFLDGSNAVLPGLLGLPADYYQDATGRQLILVSNIRDANYYDPSYPIYIAGFYSPTFEVYFDRNIMSIDAYDWANRTGPSGTRPYLYEGVFAHEYQHLLHDDYDSDEENFVNEGMADLAELLVGYKPALQSHVDAAVANPENSLMLWGDQGDLEILTDYGQAFFFQDYLMEQFGKPYIQALFHNQANGMAGVDSTLAAFNIQKDFAEVFHNWSIAMLIDSPKAQYLNGIREFDKKMNMGTPAAPNSQAYDTPGAPPWGTDYLWVTGDPKALAKFTFNGVDYSTFPTRWSSDGSVLWGGTGDLVDNWAIFPATGGGTLTFDTKYDIEEFWDFGFVQVSTDGGKTWTSLSNASTTSAHDVNAHPNIIANLPGLTGSTGGAWVPMSYDLSAYAGQDILIGLRYMTDWSTTEAGWFVDNVKVGDTLISDGTSTAAFKDLTEILPINNNFAVTFVGITGTGSGAAYKTLTLKLNHVSEEGLFELNKILKSSTSAMLLVTAEMPADFTRYVDYSYSFSFTNSGPKK